MRRAIVILFVLFNILLNTEYGILNTTYAQNSCDRCGYCEGGTKPSDYDACVACLYSNPGPPPSVEIEMKSWTVVGCIETTPGGFIQRVVQIATSAIGGIMFLVFLYGGFKILTSAGDPEQLASGKRLVTSSIIAIFIVLFSVFILQFIGVQILKLPGLG